MSEQQRVLTTVVLCFGIWFGWQVFFGEPPSTPTDSAFEATAPGATSPAADASGDAATSDDNAAHRELAGQIGRALSSAAAPSEPLPYASRTLTTPKYFARLRNNDAAFEKGVPLPGLALATSLYLEARAHGEGRNGNQALFRVYDRMSNQAPG